MKPWWNSFKIAFSMYSKVPMPKSEWTKENMRYIMCLFPLIGVIIGAVTWLWGYWGLQITQSHLFYSVVLVLIPVVITGGIHLDGLLDTSDALHSYQPRERKLEILKDSHAGAFAIITAAVYFLFYLGIYSEMTLKALPVVSIGFVLSRAMGGFSIAAAVLMLVYEPVIGGCVLAAAALEYLYYYKMSQKEFGGITGDLAGFHMQLCELVIAFGAVIGEKLCSWL